MKLLYVLVFGLLGVLARYLTAETARALSLTSLPYSTFFVNLLGAFLIGLVFVGSGERAWIDPELKTGLTVGFLGGFTTFSALALESVTLYAEGRAWHAALYLFFTNALGVAAVVAGIWAGRLAFR